MLSCFWVPFWSFHLALGEHIKNINYVWTNEIINIDLDVLFYLVLTLLTFQVNFNVQVKWKQEIKAKEETITLVDDERKAKEASRVNASRRQEALRRKIEIDFQRHKDDSQRLTEELARLQTAGLNLLISPSANAIKTTVTDAKSVKEPNAKPPTGFGKPQDSPKKLNRNRVCVICKKEKNSVVLLPCSHQVLCANCNEMHEKLNGCCPGCDASIEERVLIYGASS